MENIIKEKRNLKKDLKILPGYILVILWTAFTFIMIGWIMVASLSTTKGIFSNEIFTSGIHLENYVKAFTNNKVGTFFLNSMLYTFTACFGIVAVAAPCAYALSRYKFFGSKLITNAFIGALGIPIIMIILPLFSTLAKSGLLNSRITLIVLYICVNVPFTVFFLLGFFKTISTAFEEAAAIDGCGPIKTFWMIILPLAQPGIITVTIFNFITVWNEFFMALVFANNSEIKPLALGLYSMTQSMRYSGDWAGMFASVVIVFLPTIVLYVFLSEKIISGVTGGGVKG